MPSTHQKKKKDGGKMKLLHVIVKLAVYSVLTYLIMLLIAILHPTHEKNSIDEQSREISVNRTDGDESFGPSTGKIVCPVEMEERTPATKKCEEPSLMGEAANAR